MSPMCSERADYIAIEYHALGVTGVRTYNFPNDGRPIEFPLAFFEERPDIERSVFFVNRDFLFLACLCTLRLFGLPCQKCSDSNLVQSMSGCRGCVEECAELLAANFPDYEIDHDTVDLLLDFVPGMQFAWLISLARVGKDGKEVHGLLLMLRLKLFNHLFPSARGRPIRSLRDQRPWNCLEALMRWTCRDRQQQGTLPNPQPNPGLCLVWRETWNLFLQWAPGDYTPQTAKSSKEVEQTGATSYGTLPTDKTLPRTARRELDRRAVCRTVIAAIDKGLQSVFYPPVPTHTVNVAPVEDEHSKLPLDDCAVYSDGDDTVAEGGEMRSFFPPLIRARARTHVEEPVFELVSRRSLVKRAEAYVHRMLGATETAQNC